MTSFAYALIKVWKNYLTMFDIFSAWQEQAEKLKNGEITKEEYDNWRYNYPESVAFNYHKEK